MSLSPNEIKMIMTDATQKAIDIFERTIQEKVAWDRDRLCVTNMAIAMFQEMVIDARKKYEIKPPNAA